ncbi:MAG: sigma-70 family RNA polymerase sigma factor [Nannocystaceae bacterium]
MPRTSLSTRGFRAFYRNHYGFVWASVRRFGVPAALLDDAAQDTFVVAYRRRAELSPPTARSWLYGIARRVASNYRRTAARSTRKRHAIAHATTEVPAQLREAQVLLHDLDRFLEALPARDRELFVLSEVEGFTGPELAEALGCNMSTAYGRVRTLRLRFAELGSRDDALERAREQRPRATARGWALLLPSLRASEPGWLGLGTVGTHAVAAGLGGTVAAVVMAAVVAVSRPAANDEAAATIDGEGSSVPVTAPARPKPGPASAATPTPAIAPPEVSASASTVNHAAAEPMPTPPGPASRRAASPTPATADDDALARENALLTEATRALAQGDADAALRATDRHAASFADGALADLRTALRVEALCAQGKVEQARGEARAHAAAHPRSALRSRILRACPADSRGTGHREG